MTRCGRPAVVVPSVQREMRLRRGGKVCALRNNAFDPIGMEPGGGDGTSRRPSYASAGAMSDDAISPYGTSPVARGRTYLPGCVRAAGAAAAVVLYWRNVWTMLPARRAGRISRLIPAPFGAWAGLPDHRRQPRRRRHLRRHYPAAPPETVVAAVPEPGASERWASGKMPTRLQQRARPAAASQEGRRQALILM